MNEKRKNKEKSIKIKERREGKERKGGRTVTKRQE